MVLLNDPISNTIEEFLPGRISIAVGLKGRGKLD